MTDKASEMNRKMVEFCPELASKYATYPLQNKAWMDANASGGKDLPMWISAPKGSPRKMDYVHGAGKKGWGYYHLMTRDSYTILYARLTNEMPGCCCAVTPAQYKKVSDWDDVKTIVYNRSVATIPNDQQAKQDAIKIARGVAKAHYHSQQNFQLAVGGALLATGD